MFFGSFQYRVDTFSKSEKYPIFLINKVCFPSMDHFFAVCNASIESFFKSGGDVNTFMHLISTLHSEMLCIYQKTRFNVTIESLDERCTCIIPYTNEQDVCALITSQEDMVLTTRNNKSAKILFTVIINEDLHWYFCDGGYIFIDNVLEGKFCLYLN